MLFQLRETKNVTAKQLCEGICTVSAYSRYENNSNVPDSLLFYHLLQRLGVPPEDFSIMVNMKEYAYFLWKDKTADAIRDKKWDELENLLKQDEAIQIVCNEKIQKQHYYYLKAILAAEKEDDKGSAISYLHKAARETISEIENIFPRGTLLGGIELQILILYLHFGLITNKLSPFSSKNTFEKLEDYILQNMIDKREQVKYYPKLICIWLRESKENIPLNKRIMFLEKALELLVVTMDIFDITEVLRQKIEIYLDIDFSKYIILQKQYETMKIILEDAGVSSEFQPTTFYEKKPKLYILHELIYSKRHIKGMTQEEVCEGICAPESYSRVETGRRTPTTKNYDSIAEKLDIEWGYYKGELVTEDYQLYQLRILQKKAFVENRWEDAKIVLDEMAEKLDMTESVNFRYVESKLNMLEYQLNNLTAEQAYEKNMELVSLIIPNSMEELKYLHFSQSDMELIAQTAIMLRGMERYQEGSTLLERVLQILRNSEVDIKYQWNGVDYLIRVLSDIYFSQGRYEESLQLSGHAFQINIKLMDAGNLAEILDAMADNLEHMGEAYKEKYCKMYRNIFYVADLFKLFKWKNFMKEYYEEHFDDAIEWY